MNNNIDFLGSSQTFLGVLATIIILFIFKNKTNLIHKLLREFMGKVSEQIQHIYSTIISSISFVVSSEQYDKLTDFCISDSTDQKLIEDAYFLKVEISTKKDDLLTKYMVEHSKSPKVLKAISTPKEIILAPFYTLLFLFIIFVFDEFLRVGYFSPDFVLSWLACFICFSFIFMMIIWTKYLLKFSCFEVLLDSNNQINKFSNNLFYSLSLFKKIVLCFALLSIFPILASALTFLIIFHPIFPILLSFIIPFTVIGIFMSIIKKKDKEYSYLYMSGHFFLNLTLSFCLVWIYLALSKDHPNGDSIFLMDYNINYFKLSIFSFTILNGILFPFALPFITFLRYYYHFKDKRIEFEVLKEDLTNKLNNLVNKLPNTP